MNPTHRLMGKIWFSSITSAIVSLLVYLPALQNGFIPNWDDNIHILDNIHIRSFNLDFICWALTDYKTNLWHPVTWISHAVDYFFWGLNPFGHHLTNILIHAVNTGIVVLLAARLIQLAVLDENSKSTGKQNISMVLIASTVTGLLFGLHPLHVESVAWVSERKDLLYSLFYMLSISYYIRHVTLNLTDSSHRICLLSHPYQLSLLMFVLSVASKPMAVTLPVVLLLLDWYPLQRLKNRDALPGLVLEKLPFILLSAMVAVITVIAQKDAGGLRSLHEAPLVFRFLVAMKSITLYLCNVIAPTRLLPLHLYPTDHALLKPEYLIPPILLLTVTAACIYLKTHRFLTATWLIFITMLLPVLGLFQAGGQSMADRFMYLASVAPFMLIGLSIAYFWSHSTVSAAKAIVTLLAIAWICFLTHTTIRQIAIWKNGAILWDYLIGSNPASDATVYLMRAEAYEKQGMVDKALADYATVIEVNSKFDAAYSYRGLLFLNTGQYENAIADFTTAISLVPDNAHAYNNRGKAYRLIGRTEPALQDINKAIGIKPTYYPAYVNRGNVMKSLGQFGNAVADFTSALALNPDLPDVIFARGEAYMKIGNKDSAMLDYKAACSKGLEDGCKMLSPSLTPNR